MASWTLQNSNGHKITTSLAGERTKLRALGYKEVKEAPVEEKPAQAATRKENKK